MMNIHNPAFQESLKYIKKKPSIIIEIIFVVVVGMSVSFTAGYSIGQDNLVKEINNGLH